MNRNHYKEEKNSDVPCVRNNGLFLQTTVNNTIEPANYIRWRHPHAALYVFLEIFPTIYAIQWNTE